MRTLWQFSAQTPRLLLLVFVSALGTPAPACAQITPEKGGYLFRKRFQIGQKFSYRVLTSVRYGTQRRAPQGSRTLLETLIVKDVKNGVATLERTEQVMGARKKPSTRLLSQTLKVDALGKTDGSPIGGGAFAFALPEKPLKLGESFKMRLDGGANSQDRLLHTLTFAGMKTLGKQRVAHWKLVTAGKGAALLTGKGDLFLAEADGSLYRSNLTLEAIVVQEGRQTRIFSTTVTTRL